MAEPEETGQEQREPDYSKMSEEELEAEFRAGKGLIIEREDEPGETQDEPVEPAKEQEEQAEPSEPPAQEPPAAEIPESSEEEFDESKSQVEELRLLLDLEKKQREHFNQLQSRAFHEKEQQRLQYEEQIRQLTSAQSTRQREDYSEEPIPQPPLGPGQPVPDPYSNRLAALESWMKAQAVEAEYAKFLKENPGVEGNLEEMASDIQQAFAPYANNVSSYSAQDLKTITRMALDSAYAQHQIKQLRQRREEALKRRAEQMPKRKQAKQAATVSGSGGTPPPRAKPKQPEEMTAEEADRELIKLFGDGHYRRSRR